MLSKEEVIAQARSNKDYTGVYFLVKGDEIIYIGCSFHIGRRIITHGISVDFDYYSFIEVDTEDKLALQTVEAGYIIKFNPKFNHGISTNYKYVNINSEVSIDAKLIRSIKSIRSDIKVRALTKLEIKVFECSSVLSGKMAYILYKDQSRARKCLLELCNNLKKRNSRSLTAYK